MPTRTIETSQSKKTMIPFNAESTKAIIRAFGYHLTDIAAYLHPQYENRANAYHHFKYWLKVGRMPSDKYRLMCDILANTSRTSDSNNAQYKCDMALIIAFAKDRELTEEDVLRIADEEMIMKYNVFPATSIVRRLSYVYELKITKTANGIFRYHGEQSGITDDQVDWNLGMWGGYGTV